MTSLFTVVWFIGVPIGSVMSEVPIQKQWMTRNTSRKFFTALGNKPYA